MQLMQLALKIGIENAKTIYDIKTVPMVYSRRFKHAAGNPRPPIMIRRPITKIEIKNIALLAPAPPDNSLLQLPGYEEAPTEPE